MSNKSLTAKGVSLALLISKHGGWLDDNDKDVIRFPTPHAMAMFERELEECRKAERV
jgi:hypothetical protein